MKIIKENPFRIAGLLANSSQREIERNKSKYSKYLKIKKQPISDFDFEFLGELIRTEESVSDAFSKIEQAKDKVSHSLFWFLNTSPFDHTAIDYFKNGDGEKALEIWEKVTNFKDVNAKNFSAFNNVGTYKLLSPDVSDIQEGIEAKFKLINSDYFDQFVHAVADETFTINSQKQIDQLIDELIKGFKGRFSTSEKIQLFQNCDERIKQYVKVKFTEEPLHKIETQIESCKKKRKTDKGSAYQLGLRLFNGTKGDLALLKSLFGTSDLNYKAVADQLANEIMQCGIDYFNESQENDSDENYLESAQKLTKMADTIAVGNLAKDRAKDSLATLAEMKDRVLHQVLDLMKSVKDTYETNESNIRRQINDMLENDIELKFGFKTINYTAVEENIKNSIDWGKVNELLNEILTFKGLKQIKESSHAVLKNEFWEMLNWLKKYTQKENGIELIMDQYKKIPPKLKFEIISGEIKNTDSKLNEINEPFYVEHIRYVGLKLKIRASGHQTITLYKKYINPEGKYSHSSKSSPEGYTSYDEFTITPFDNELDLSGWGNSKECTYKVGMHKIEIYVEHYKVFTKTFEVDWTPKKKARLEKQLSQLQSELSEVEKFQWFRTGETKERQVKEVKSRIKEAKNLLMNR